MINIYMFGYGSYTLETPNIEPLQHYLDRKKDSTGWENTPEWAAKSLNLYESMHVGFVWFIGTPEEFEQFKFDYPIQERADKGQEVENAIEINDLIKNYAMKQILETTKSMSIHEIKLFNPNVTDPAIKEANFNAWKILRGDRDNNIATWEAVELFERDMAIATNVDKSHVPHWIHEALMIIAMNDIKANDAARWEQLTKMLRVEQSYEPEAVIEEWKKLQDAVNNHLAGQTTAGTTKGGA